MTSSTSLPASTRSAVVLIALLQGLALYAAYQFDGHWPFQDVGSRYRWHAWILTIPTAIALTVVNLRDRRLWLHALAGSLVVVALASWVAWNLHGDSSLDAAPLRTPFSLAMAIATFILLPWWQHRLQHGHWRASYDALFQHAWQNGLTLALALFFTGLTWLLLWLWAALFGLLKIDFFKDLFQQAAFISLATGALAGFGVLIGRTQQRAIQITRLVLFAICRGLLPLLSFIAVLFVLSLPFTGLQPLWETRSAASLLLTLALLLITFTNAVYQHDDERPPYPRWLRGLVEGGLFALPVLAGLAIYAMSLRIGQHGWTLDRFWGALTALLVAGYAAGYALAPLHRAGRWLQRLEPVNRAMCWVVLAAALLGSSPLLDPVRITLASQRARLLAEPARLTAADALMLRFEVGHRGVSLLRELQKHASVHSDARAASVIAQALGRSARWEGPPPSMPAPAISLHCARGFYWQRTLRNHRKAGGRRCWSAGCPPASAWRVKRPAWHSAGTWMATRRMRCCCAACPQAPAPIACCTRPPEVPGERSAAMHSRRALAMLAAEAARACMLPSGRASSPLRFRAGPSCRWTVAAPCCWTISPKTRHQAHEWILSHRPGPSRAWPLP